MWWDYHGGVNGRRARPPVSNRTKRMDFFLTISGRDVYLGKLSSYPKRIQFTAHGVRDMNVSDLIYSYLTYI